MIDEADAWQVLSEPLRPPEEIAELARLLTGSPPAMALVDELMRCPAQAFELPDLASRAGLAEEEASRDLARLVEWDLVVAIPCGRRRFYAAQLGGQRGEQLRRFWSWRERCLEELRSLEVALASGGTHRG